MIVGLPRCKACSFRHDPLLRCNSPSALQQGAEAQATELNAGRPLVVNAMVVNGRSKDRHKKTPERAAYLREAMRKQRAKNKRSPMR